MRKKMLTKTYYLVFFTNFASPLYAHNGDAFYFIVHINNKIII